jgi:long-chain acyl-CoA synthetase
MSPIVSDLLRESAERFPDRIAVIDGSRRITYATLYGGATDLSRRLVASGLVPGERVLIVLKNSAEYIVSYFAVMMACGIAVPIGHQTTERGLRRILADCTPSIVIGHIGKTPAHARSLQNSSSVRTVIDGDSTDFAQTIAGNGGNRFREYYRCAEGKESDVALILYTSGTTGQPKGVMLTHRNLAANAASIVEYLKLTHEDRGMVILPFHYSYGNSLLTTHVMVGGSLVFENSFVFPNVVLERIEEEQVTGFAGVPSTFAILLNRSNLRRCTFPHMRYVTQAGGAMSPKLAADLRVAIPGADVFIMYGQTEATARLTYLDPSDLLQKAGSIGKAIPGVRITLRKEDGALASPGEVGEIVAEGDNVMAGYWNKPAETAEVLQNGCLHTGDLAKTDEEGFLYIVGRRSEMIKTGGRRVSPKEIEEVISGIPGICEVAVVGVQDEMLGQAIRAFVVLERGENVFQKDVLKHCLENLEPFLVPQDVVFLEELPKSLSGKVDRTGLKCRESEQ